MRLMGIDMGPYVETVDFELLKEKGLEFVIIKATQGNYRVNGGFLEKMESALIAGLKVGLYHWCDPLVSAEKQAAYFLEKTAGLPYHFSATDIEQQWADWTEWANKAVTQLLSPKLISENGRVITERLAAGSGRQVLVYSRASFVHEFALPMLNWIGDWPLWMAHYPYGSARVTTTWEDFVENCLPGITDPLMPNGCDEWKMWQFTGDKFYLPGVDLPVDVNFFNGDKAALYAFCGLEYDESEEPAEEEEDETEESLTLEGLAERVASLEAAAERQGWELA